MTTIKELLAQRAKIQEELHARLDETLEIRQRDLRAYDKAAISELAMTLPEIPTSLYNNLTSSFEAFQTGSTVYGDAFLANDLDFCICAPPHVLDPFVTGQGDAGYWESDGFSTVYGNYKGQLVNFICFSDHALYRAWYKATKAMVKLASANGILDPNMFRSKWRRVRVFRALCDAFYEPLSPSSPNLSVSDAIRYSKCTLCGREAINFTCKSAKDHYLGTGICERCTSGD